MSWKDAVKIKFDAIIADPEKFRGYVIQALEQAIRRDVAQLGGDAWYEAMMETDQSLISNMTAPTPLNVVKNQMLEVEKAQTQRMLIAFKWGDRG